METRPFLALLAGLVPGLALATEPFPAPASAAAPAPAATPGPLPTPSVHGQLQAGFNSHPEAQALADDAHVSFGLQRAQIALEGELVPERMGYAVTVDFAESAGLPGGAGVPVRDAVLEFRNEGMRVRLGQFRTPLSREGGDGPADVFLPERSTIVKSMGRAYDPGVEISQEFPGVRVSLSAQNGSGPNQADRDGSKDLALRVDGDILDADALRLALGATILRTLGPKDDPGRLAWAADVRFEAGAATVQGELLGQQWVQAKKDGGEVDPQKGGYLLFGYTLGALAQPVVRLGFFDAPGIPTSVEAGNTDEYDWTVGVNFFVIDQGAKGADRYSDHPEWSTAKLQAAWQQFYDKKFDTSAGSLIVSALGAF